MFHVQQVKVVKELRRMTFKFRDNFIYDNYR